MDSRFSFQKFILSITLYSLNCSIVSTLKYATLIRGRNYFHQEVNAVNNHKIWKADMITRQSSLLSSSFGSSASFSLIESVNDTAVLSPKPPLLYLPGLDGLGEYSFSALNQLSEQYESWRLVVKSEDRSNFIDLARCVMNKLDTFNQSVVLIGESFGGVLASYLAYRMGSKVSRLILINPATSVSSSLLFSLAPYIAKSGPLYPFVGLSSLLLTSIQPSQFVGLGTKIIQGIQSGDNNEKVSDVLKPLLSLPDSLPSETLSWRIKEWLDTGNFLLKDHFDAIRTPTLLLIGEDDRLLPSGKEGPRLRRELKNSFVSLKIFPGRGHALLDNTFELKKYVDEFEKTVIRKETGDTSIELPSKVDIDLIDKQFAPLFFGLSPVYMSTSEDGLISEGLGNVPTGNHGRPVLLVGNHQILGLDLSLIVREFIREKNILIRGLAHPMIFNTSTPFSDLMIKFGAVQVSPMSFYQLLKSNETILLFPGGAREAFHKKGEEYKLFWPEKQDFVRMAALMDAIIVPYASVGMYDSVNMILDRDDYAKIPGLEDLILKGAANAISARASRPDEFVSPLIAPSLPSRNYFLFLKPIDTRTFNSKSKQECKTVYEGIKNDLQGGINALLRYRVLDPNRELIPRLINDRLPGKSSSKIPSLSTLSKFVSEEQQKF